MVANGRWYFEGHPLGNQQPLTMQSIAPRQVKGHYEGGAALDSPPIIGSYGFARRVVITAQHAADDGDWLTFQSAVETLEGLLAATTQALERAAIVQHSVEDRRLGYLGYVVNNDLTCTAQVVSTALNLGDAFASVRFTFSGTTLADVFGVDEIVDGDLMVIAEDTDQPTIGEIAVIQDTDSDTYIEFVSRLADGQGSPLYNTGDGILVRLVEASYAGMAYRDMTIQPPKSMADGGFAANGIKVAFEGRGHLARRTGVPVVEFSNTAPLYGGHTTTTSGVAYHGLVPSAEEYEPI